MDIVAGGVEGQIRRGRDATANCPAGAPGSRARPPDALREPYAAPACVASLIVGRWSGPSTRSGCGAARSSASFGRAAAERSEAWPVNLAVSP